MEGPEPSAPKPAAVRPLLVYDGDCGFCRRWVRRWKLQTGPRVDFAPYQEVAERFQGIPLRAFRGGVQWIEPDGTVASNAKAVCRMLAVGAGRPGFLWGYNNLPFFADSAEFVYGIVARHRVGADRVDRVLIGGSDGPFTNVLTRALFLRALGVIYLCAFISLWVQVQGLIGSQGILPVAKYLHHFASAGPKRFWYLPTLCWLDSSDRFLNVLCGGGVAMAALLIIGIAPALMLAGLWAFYLSLCTAGQQFLSFQWDYLLLEAGFLAIFFAPLRVRPRLSAGPPPSRLVLWLLRWLAFRLNFMSGVVKLTGDYHGAWHKLTALNFHYYTQPLPPWTAWYAQHLPGWFQSLSVRGVFGAELIAPWLFLGPRRLRMVGACATVLFQTTIMATGNYGFFNLLTIVLCIPLLDDAVFLRWRRRRAETVPADRAAGRFYWPLWVTAPVGAVIATASVFLMIEAIWPDHQPPDWYGWAVRPLGVVNSYGLFRDMTTQRFEIEIQGSDDQVNWKAYEFKWKPGDVSRRPAFMIPHMPRLDWQMWFAALVPPDECPPWLENFMLRLLEGSKPVLGLMGSNPFPDHPPRYIRARLYDYHFTSAEERRATGAWWRREEMGPYCPPYDGGALTLRPPGSSASDGIGF